MATIKPFRGCRYDRRRCGQPISSHLSALRHDRAGTEIRASAAQPLQRGPSGGRRTTRPGGSAGRLPTGGGPVRRTGWPKASYCREDAAAAFYVMRHAYNFGGRHYQHLGLFADVLVEDYDAGAVLAPRVYPRALRAGPRCAAGRLPGPVQPHHVPVSRFRGWPPARILDDVVAAST